MLYLCIPSSVGQLNFVGEPCSKEEEYKESAILSIVVNKTR